MHDVSSSTAHVGRKWMSCLLSFRILI